ncbi:MAG: LTA synthase family protein [Erysipelothrix sp.]|nr:LTA synthase family protein [Erysipelothrix sp.]
MKNLNSKKNTQLFIYWMLVSFGLVLLIELFNRRSISEMIDFLISHPMVFFYNACLVALSFSLVFFTKRQRYTFYLVYGTWLSLAIINMVIRTFRMTPLTLDDAQFIANITKIMPLYLNTTQIIIIILSSLMLIIGLLFSFFKSQPKQRLFKKGFIHVGVIGMLLMSMPTLSSSVARFSETDGNLKTTYDEFGFAYSFIQSAISKGVKRPLGFDQDILIQRLQGLNKDQSDSINANVIALQLESFFDVNRLSTLQLQSNPIPYFSYLKNNYPSGILTVPTIGGGTANSEFEFLTGMDLSYFGVGEYPYKTILREKSLPSLVSYFNEQNYTTTAIHNHVANFYRRQVVYKYLGFDYFVSLETMKDVTTTPKGWAKDKHLIPYIQSAMAQSYGRDFVFAVSVQAHGDFPNDPLGLGMIQYVNPSDGKSNNNINYYLNQLNEMDLMIEELVTWVQSHDEPTILVLYGDHLPGLEFGLDDTASYQTDYVIVANFELNHTEQNLDLPKLGSKVLSLIKHPGTTINQVQQRNFLDKETLQWIHYDWVEGSQVSMDSVRLPKTMMMGLKAPKVTNISFVQDYVILEGSNFFPSTQIIIDGKPRETTYISEYIVLFEGPYDGEYPIEFAIVSDNREIIKIIQ